MLFGYITTLGVTHIAINYQPFAYKKYKNTRTNIRHIFTHITFLQLLKFPLKLIIHLASRFILYSLSLTHQIIKIS